MYVSTNDKLLASYGQPIGTLDGRNSASFDLVFSYIPGGSIWRISESHESPVCHGFLLKMNQPRECHLNHHVESAPALCGPPPTTSGTSKPRCAVNRWLAWKVEMGQHTQRPSKKKTMTGRMCNFIHPSNYVTWYTMKCDGICSYMLTCRDIKHSMMTCDDV